METYSEYLVRKDFDRDQIVFDKLSPRARELMMLKAQAEKSIGQENSDLQALILEKSRDQFPCSRYVIAHGS